MGSGGDLRFIDNHCLFVNNIALHVYQFAIGSTGGGVTNNEITISTGILLRRFKSVSFDQVQDIDITVGILKSIFGLGDINIWTASQSQTGNGLPKSDGALTLGSKDAEWLKNFILDNRPGA